MPVNSSAPHTMTNNSPKGRPLNPAAKQRRAWKPKRRMDKGFAKETRDRKVTGKAHVNVIPVA